MNSGKNLELTGMREGRKIIGYNRGMVLKEGISMSLLPEPPAFDIIFHHRERIKQDHHKKGGTDIKGEEIQE